MSVMHQGPRIRCVTVCTAVQIPPELQDVSWQDDAASLGAAPWDTIIAGGGPAGATAAYHLASAGHRVLLLERHRYPRDKVCGDGLIADAIQALQRLELAERVRELGFTATSARVYSPRRIAVNVPGRYWTLPRRILDGLIAHRAAQVGAVVACGTVENIESTDSGAVAVLPQGIRLSARAILLATGAHIGLSERLGHISRRRASALALRYYVRSSHRMDHLLISYDRSILPGYAWIFPLGDGLYNIGCGTFYSGRPQDNVNLRKMLQRFVDAFPAAVDIMHAGEIVSSIKGARLRCGLEGSRPSPQPRLLSIGETAGATYPFTGEGIGKAMQTGELAAELVDAALQSDAWAVLQRFEERIASQLAPKYVAYATAQAWLSYPWLCDLVAARARRSRYVRHALAGIIEESVAPRAVFSVGGLLRSLVS